MHSARFVSGLAPFLERIGTRSQDSINEVSIAEKVTRFTSILNRFSTEWPRRYAVKVQSLCPVCSGFSGAVSATDYSSPKCIDSGLVLRVSGPSAMPTVLCYILLKRSRSDRS